jgi:hypothetical protein
MAGVHWAGYASALAAIALSFGCYSGVESIDGAADGGGPGGADDGADDGDDGADDGEGPVEGQCGDPQTGPTALRRLTNAQYHRTIRDLLGIDAVEVESFAPDERIGAFKSNGSAPVVDLQVEQYMDAAEVIATAAAADLAGLLPCDPGAIGEDACAEELIRTMGPRAYRRPLDEAEIAALVGVYLDGKAEGDFANGIRVALQGMLQSPYFLYHVELGTQSESDGAPVSLTGHELAARLSYFLWDSMPDEALFAAAEAGELYTDEGLEAQVERMLEDPKAAEAIASFHLQWLGVDEIDGVEKDGVVYPAFTAELAASMKAETAAFANWVIGSGDARLETLLTSNVSLTDDPNLLALYGVTLPPGHVPGEPVELPATERAGLLTQASLLARHAHADQTSPVHRGKLVRENFLCTPLPPPPGDVDNVPPDPTPGATTRQRFAEHVEDPACAGCHVLIDGLGFGFEGYDGIGAFRTMEEGQAVDASGEVVGTDDIDGPFVGAVELAAKLAESDQVRACVATQWFRYALGRIDTGDDQCAFDHMNEAFAASDYDVRELVKTIVLSDSFRFRRVDALAEAQHEEEEI